MPTSAPTTSVPTTSTPATPEGAPPPAPTPAQSRASHSPTSQSVEVAVIGGSVGGLAASIALARSLRSVVVIDAGAPRNAASTHAHNVLGQEGINPLDLVAKGRREAEDYGVKFVDATVDSVQSTTSSDAGPSFELVTSAGAHIRAQRIIIATGLTDELPDIPGLSEGWGESVLHCPYCHGYEVRGQNIGIIGTTAMSYHQAMMFSQLSDRVTFLRHDSPEPDAEQTRILKALGVEFIDARVETASRTAAGTVVTLNAERAEGDSAVEPAAPAASAATPASAAPPASAETAAPATTELTFDALAVGPYFRANSELFTQLGGTVIDHPSGMGSHIPAQPSGATDIPGVWAVGNSADISAMVLASAASGVMVGAQVNAELIMSSVS